MLQRPAGGNSKEVYLMIASNSPTNFQGFEPGSNPKSILRKGSKKSLLRQLVLFAHFFDFFFFRRRDLRLTG